MVYQYTIPRKPIGAMQNSPGPIYALPSIFDKSKARHNSNYSNAPSWKIGSLINRNRFITDGPGPSYNVDSKLLRTGICKTQKFSIHSKSVEPANMVTPAPDLYFTEKSYNKISHQKSAPSYSISGRPNQMKIDNNPAPNSYDIKPTLGKICESGKVSAPAYSIYGRKNIGSFNEDLRGTPGPNKYALPPSNTYKSKLPVYSLYGRNQMPGDMVSKPGPGAYKPEKVSITLKSAPVTSFGIKHSAYASGFVLPADLT